MAIDDTHTDTTHAARFCGECGSELGGARFCPNCGTPSATASPFDGHAAAAGRAADAVAGHDVPPPQNFPPPRWPDPNGTTAAPAGSPRSRRPLLIAAVVAALLIAAGATAALFIFSGGSDDGDNLAKYQDQVTVTLKPVDAANLRLSNALSRLDRGRPTQALSAVALAKDATSAARGALGALAVPEGGDGIAAQVRQALDREQTYLNAVDSALSRPSGPGASQLPTLAGNLTSALEAVDAPIAGPDNVRGVDELTAWVQRTRAANRRGSSNGATPPQPSNPGPESPLARGRDCGNGTHAGPNTTCEFARLVRQAWNEAPGLAATVDVYSPATGRTHTMNCSPAGNGISCSGGNNASVSW